MAGDPDGVEQLLFEEFFLIVAGQDAFAVLAAGFSLSALEVFSHVGDVVLRFVFGEEFGGLVQCRMGAGVKYDGQFAGFVGKLLLDAARLARVGCLGDIEPPLQRFVQRLDFFAYLGKSAGFDFDQPGGALHGFFDGRGPRCFDEESLPDDQVGGVAVFFEGVAERDVAFLGAPDGFFLVLEVADAVFTTPDDFEALAPASPGADE